MNKHSQLGIPYCWNSFDEQARASLEEACASSSAKPWTDFLRSYPITDGLADLENCETLIRALGASVGDEYPLQATIEGADLSLEDSALSPERKLALPQHIFLSTWLHIRSLVERDLLAMRGSGIPARGGVLYFTSRLDRCLAFNYEILENAVDTKLTIVIPGPVSVFDFWGSVETAPPRARNQLKNLLGSGHKTIGHRNTLVHLDKTADADVFGPAIDTLYLNEMLFKYVYECEHLDRSKRGPRQPVTMLEVGCGSGLLTCAFLKNFPADIRYVALDSSFKAIACCQRNLKHQGELSRHSGAIICSGFDPSALAWKFDFVLCNPPYVPVPPRLRRFIEGDPRLEAVSGTSLLQDLNRALPTILSRQGAAFVVISSLAFPEFESSLPDGMEYRKLGPDDGLLVPFEVDPVQENQDWLDWLEAERGLIRIGDAYAHRIQALAVSRDAGTPLMQRIDAMNRQTAQTITRKGRESIMLRFRDLSVTGPDTTISRHNSIIAQHGSTWWGWWKRKHELTPQPLLAKISERLKRKGSESVFLFDSNGKLYRATLRAVAVAISEDGIRSPRPTLTPAYYRREVYMVWLNLTSIEEISIRTLQSLSYVGFPSAPASLTSTSRFIGRRISSVDELRGTDATMWVVMSQG